MSRAKVSLRPAREVWFTGAAVITILLGATAILYGIYGRSSQIFGRSVWRGRKSKQLRVALTFDDGPSPQTLELCHYLNQQGVKATFFLCGLNVLRHPGVAWHLAQAGHQLGNHTFSHKRLSPRLGWKLNFLSEREIFLELERTQISIYQDAGVIPALFRAPYGMRWFGLRDVQRRLRLLGCMWTVIGHDWEWPVAQVVSHVLRHTRPGAIICLHDGRDIRPQPDLSVMLAAVKILIPELRRKGYTFVTVGEILNVPNQV